MYQIKLVIGVIIVVALSEIKKVSSCSCRPGIHIQTLVCENDFVIKGHVFDRSPYEMDWTGPRPDDMQMMQRNYTVLVEARYKGSPSTIRDIMTISTEFDSAACGLYLEVNETYYLAGRLTDGRARVDSCNSLLGRPSVHEEKYIEDNTYAENCDCQIQFIFDYLPAYPSCTAEDCCTVEVDYDSDTPHVSELTYCARENGHCEWYLGTSAAAKESIRWAFMFTSVALAMLICFMSKE